VDRHAIPVLHGDFFYIQRSTCVMREVLGVLRVGDLRHYAWRRQAKRSQEHRAAEGHDRAPELNKKLGKVKEK
jgi:hypothetical protein